MATTITPPAPSAPAPSGGAGDFYSRVSSALSADSAPETPPDSAIESPAQPEQSPAEVPAGAVPAQETAPPEPEPEEDFQFSDEKPEAPAAEAKPAEPAAKTPQQELDEHLGVNKDVVSALLKTERGRRMYESFQIRQALEKPIEEGGLGYMPPVEQIRGAMEDSSDMAVMHHEFNSGDPAMAQNWVRQWFSPGEDGKPTPGQMAVAYAWHQTLAQNSTPEVYHAAVTPVIETLANQIFEQAKGIEDADTRLYYFNAARAIDYFMTGGKWAREIPKDLIDGPMKMDPLAQQRAELQRQQQEIQRATQSQQQEAARNFVTGMNQSFDAEMTRLAGEALAPAKEGLGARLYGQTEQNFIRDVQQRVVQNTVGFRQFQVLRDQAIRTRDPQAVEAAKQFYLSLAKPVMKQLRREYLADASSHIERRSAARHEQLANGAGKTGATSVGQPAGPPQAAPLRREPGESERDFRLRQIAAVMQP